MKAAEFDKDLSYSTWQDMLIAYEAGSKKILPLEMARWQHAQLQLKPLLEALAECAWALQGFKTHDSDCADADEKFEFYEQCECGASSVADLLSKLESVLALAEGKMK